MSEEVNQDVTPNPVTEGAKHIGRLGGLAVGNKRRAAKGEQPVVPEVTFNEETMAAYRKEFARQGGLKGGVARSAKLSKERKKEIGRLGGLARWSKHV